MPEIRVLVVDDEQSMRDLLTIMLRQCGYDVSAADGGEAAIEALKAGSFDLVITDLRMRKIDGLVVSPEQPARKVEDHVLIAKHDLVERGVVSRETPVDQDGFIQ